MQIAAIDLAVRFGTLFQVELWDFRNIFASENLAAMRLYASLLACACSHCSNASRNCSLSGRRIRANQKAASSRTRLRVFTSIITKRHIEMGKRTTHMIFYGTDANIKGIADLRIGHVVHAVHEEYASGLEAQTVKSTLVTF